MRYTREFQSGFGNDPRNKRYAVYKCEACGHDVWVHMPTPSTFDRRDRPCPRCGSMGAGDRRASLEAQKRALEAERTRIDQEIAKLVAEIESVPVEAKACGG